MPPWWHVCDTLRYSCCKSSVVVVGWPWTTVGLLFVLETLAAAEASCTRVVAHVCASWKGPLCCGVLTAQAWMPCVSTYFVWATGLHQADNWAVCIVGHTYVHLCAV